MYKEAEKKYNWLGLGLQKIEADETMNWNEITEIEWWSEAFWSGAVEFINNKLISA